MHSIIAIGAAVLPAALLFSLPGFAQTLGIDVLVNTDRSAATTFSVTPSGGAALIGFERRSRVDHE